MKNILNKLSNTLPTTEQGFVPTEDLELVIGNYSSNAVIWGAVVLVALLIIASFTKDKVPKLKTPLFALIAFNVFAVTVFLIGSTVYLNVKSESGGPVHWHADFEVWTCGQELELRDPIGRFSNKIGTATLHEHNDKRIHLEGVVVEERDASLGKFFYVLDPGKTNLTDSALQMPLNGEGDGDYWEDETDGDVNESTRSYIENNYIQQSDKGSIATFIDGQRCNDGSIADVQVFVYNIVTNEDGTAATKVVDGKERILYTQTKLEDPSEYVIAGDSLVPPGDCVIIEFAPTKPTTDKLCFQFEVADSELENYYYQAPEVPVEEPAEEPTQQPEETNEQEQETL